MAAPIAGTCEHPTPAMILATLCARRLDPPGRLLVVTGLAAVAFDQPAALEHHLGVVLLGGPGHDGGHLLEREPVGGAELGGEIDVAAELEHPVPVAPEDGFALLLGHRERAQIAR